MTDIDALADFVTEAQRRIRAILTSADYSLTLLWVTGAPEWAKLPDEAVDDLTVMLEEKRLAVIRASGALAG